MATRKKAPREMPNEELRRTQMDLQYARDRYADLYEFAPVGFLSLNTRGEILEANLTACQFLNAERKALLHQNLEAFVIAVDQPALRLHLQNVAKRYIKNVSEVLQLKHNHAHFLVRLQSLYEEAGGVHAEPIIHIALIDLTEQEQAKTLQREQEAWLGGVLDTAMDAIITVDEQQQIILFNKGAEKIFRYSSVEAMGMSIDQFIPQRFRTIHQGHVQSFMQAGDTVRSMGRLGSLVALRSDGEEFPIEASISQFDHMGKKRMTVILRDITERRKTEETLEKEQQFLSTILDTAGALVLVLDPEWQIVRFNRECENLTGRNIEEMRGKSFIDLSVVSGEDAQEVKNLLLSFKGRQFPKSFESAWVDQNRQLHWIRWSNTVVNDKEGKTENIIATGIDITNRKHAERALRREQEFISAVLDTAGALVVVLDRRGQIVRFNRACEEMTGYSFEDVQGKRIWDFLLPPKEIPAGKKVFEDLRRKGLPNQFENHWVTKDSNSRQIAWSNTALTNDKGEVDHVIGIGIDVTERRKAEQTIDRLRRQNELILHSAGEGIYGIDKGGKVTFFNQAAEKLTGWTSEELLGQVIHPVLHHTKPDGTSYLWEECPIYFSLKKGEIHQIVTDVFWRKDGTHFPAEYTSTPILDEDSYLMGAVVTFNDITERKQADDALLSSEARLLEAQRIAHVGSWELDVPNNALSWSDEIYHIFEVDRKQFGASYEAFLDSIHPDDRESVNKAYTDSVKKKMAYEIVHRLLLRDGRIKYVHERGKTFYDHNGSPIRSIGTVQDITAQKQAETKIQESEERFQAFMNHSPTVAFLKNEKGQYVYVNQLWEEKLQLSRVDCLGKTDQQLFPPELAHIFKKHDREALKTREVLETEETTFDKTGEARYWWVMKFPVHSKEGQVLLGGVALDITFRKKAEEALQQREVELQESQEVLQSLGGQLISAQEDEQRRISRELHDDMNQRLAILALNIQSAQKGLSKSIPMYQTLQKLYEGVSTLSDDVRHLAYQLHPSILDDLGLNVALRSFVDDFSKWEGIPIAFVSTDLPVSLPQAVASCLYRVTQECLRNVARHAHATQVDVKLIEEDGGLRLFVKDNGKGFKVGGKRTGQHGLGLIGMQERVRVVQGSYEVKSAPGQGTEIKVWVPIEEKRKK